MEGLWLVHSQARKKPCLKLCQRRFRLDSRENSFAEWIVQPWDRLPWAVVESLSLKGFNRCADVAIEDIHVLVVSLAVCG